MPMRSLRTFLLGAVAVILGSAGIVPRFANADVQDVTTIADILSTASTRGGESVVVRTRGVVTGGSPDSFVIQDATAAICVVFFSDSSFPQPTRPADDDLSRGSDIIVVGSVDRGGYAPRIIATEILALGTQPLPKPIPADLDRLFAGVDNSMLVELRGLVRGYREDEDAWWLQVRDGAREIAVRVAKSSQPSPPERLLDAWVRVIGIVGSVRNTRGEFLAPLLRVPDAASLVVEDSPRSAPFESPHVDLRDVGRYRFDVIPNRRITTRGVVTYAAQNGMLFIQEGDVGMRVEHGVRQTFTPGDLVEVAGFVDMSRQCASIANALVRQVDVRPPPQPCAIGPEEIVRINADARARSVIAVPSSFDGTLIQFDAHVLDSKANRDEGELLLGDGAVNLLAVLVGRPGRTLTRIPIGSVVRVTGVMQCSFESPDGRAPFSADPVLGAMRLLLRTTDDVTVIAKPPWWSSPRLFAALAATGGALVVAAGWIWSLKRQVRRTMFQLADEMKSRRNAAIEFQATLRERNRLAGQLHDTILQTLRGINFQLGACRASHGQSDAAPSEHLDVARRMVNHAAEELRGSVWALRTVPTPGRSFEESLKAISRHTAHGHRESIAVTVIGDPFETPPFVHGNLLLVAQEAMQNSLAHADASQITITATFDAMAKAIDLLIRDDGRGFLPGSESGPDQGHFGLTGMKERIERLGGTITIESTPGRGTTVHATVQMRDYDSRIDADEPGGAQPFVHASDAAPSPTEARPHRGGGGSTGH